MVNSLTRAGFRRGASGAPPYLISYHVTSSLLTKQKALNMLTTKKIDEYFQKEWVEEFQIWKNNTGNVLFSYVFNILRSFFSETITILLVTNQTRYYSTEVTVMQSFIN